MDNRPIGIFDSGLGGLTCLRELHRLLPDEEIVFFGDTARMPYGGRSPEELHRFAREDIRLLLEHNVKLVLIACGTISSTCSDLPEAIDGVPVMRLLLPCASAAVNATKNANISVIATQATIASGAFEREIKRLSPECKVTSVACPGLVPAIEDGHISPDDPIVADLLREYLPEVIASGADTLVLGCTHYPLLTGAISGILGGSVTLIDAGAQLARAALPHGAEGLHEKNSAAGRCRYLVSGDTALFAANAAGFLGEDISASVAQAHPEPRSTVSV